MLILTEERRRTHHVIDLIHTNQPACQLEHVVSQRDDDELCILRSLLDVAGYNTHIPEV